jgi:hypothetical protein
MKSLTGGRDATTKRFDRAAQVIAVVVGLFLLVAGFWAFFAPRDFFENAATFEPFNRHFIRDIGAFQIGLGAVLLAGVFLRDALLAVLAGVAVGSGFHFVAHVIDRELGGTTEVDLPLHGLITVLLIAGAVARAVANSRR